MHAVVKPIEETRTPWIEAEAPFQEEEKTDLRQYWRIIYKNRWGILGLAFVVGLLTLLWAYSMTPIYRATTSLLIEPKPAKFIDIQQGLDAGVDTWRYYKTQYDIIKSRAIAEDVVERLELWKHPLIDPAKQPPKKPWLGIDWRSWLPLSIFPEPAKAKPPSEEALKQRAMGMVMGGLTVSSVRDSQLVKISFDSPDPELSARIANTVADAYIESQFEARLQMAKKAVAWLKGRLENLRQKVEASEKALQAYREKEGLVDVSGVRTLTSSQIEDVATRLAQARSKRLQLENLLRQLKSGSAENLDAHPSLLSDPLIQQLKASEAEAERKLSELSKRYGPKHPKMIAAQSDLEAVRRKLREALSEVSGGIAKRYQIALANERDLSREFEALKKQMQDINRKEFKLQALQREVETNRELYNMFLTRFKETSTAGDVETANARVVDAAAVPGAPYKPNK
ncbi:MAG: hypothetical protein D6819_06880, partial [Gammaproteobacteria bacterium]